MKAAIYRRYGPPDVVQIDDVEKPVPRDNEVLIKVCAASVNPIDWHLIRGMPYMLRIAAGLRKPKMTRLGSDVAGEVEAVGRTVTQFKPGDPVFGLCRGTLAEYVCVSESALARKPDNLTFEQAASVPLASLTALQACGDEEEIQPWQKVLINGAAGGVGTFAVQIAKSFGAHVTGVCSTRNVEMVRSIGADQVIDYTQEDFTQGWQHYDLILDCVGNHSLSACRSVLTPKGKYIMVGGPAGQWMIRLLGRVIKALVLSWFVQQKLTMMITKASKENLIMMCELMETRKVRPVIDRRYTLSEVPEAIRYLEEGHARGKVVINL